MRISPTFGPLANTHLSLVERTLLRQANLRAAERSALAERDLKTHLGELTRISRDEAVALSKLPQNVVADLRVSVEDYTSSARTLHPSPEDLFLSLKQMVYDAIERDDADTRDFVQTVIGWAIEAYFAR